MRSTTLLERISLMPFSPSLRFAVAQCWTLAIPIWPSSLTELEARRICGDEVDGRRRVGRSFLL